MDHTVSTLRTGQACTVVRLPRERFNEAAAIGLLPCLPATTAGRARRFDQDDLLALWYYRELTEDGYAREKAGHIACAIAARAKNDRLAGKPEAVALAYVDDYFTGNGAGCVYDPSDIPSPALWADPSGLLNETDIRKVTIFNVGKTRALIAHYTTREIANPSED